MRKLFLACLLSLVAFDSFAQQRPQPQEPQTPPVITDTVLAGGNVQRTLTYTRTQYFTAAQYQTLLTAEQTALATATAQVTAMQPIATQAQTAASAAAPAISAAPAGNNGD